ncbi:MAG: hypothetical protein Q7T81_15005 [Pseudolabrys sp.]|nr:hypothetical protein [Pseudolabrys sp.]
MNAFKKIAVAAAAFAALAGFAGQASAGTVWAQNKSKNAIWVTVYLYNGHNGKQGYFCILPGETKNASNSTIGNVGDKVTMRAEVKKTADHCGGKNLFDIDTKLQTSYANNRAMVVYTSHRFNDYPQVTTGWK